jgi:simple sugar transport system ATP-binding protein
MESADTITVLRDGRNVGSVPAAETTREELAEMMVGREVIFEVETEDRDPGRTGLAVSDLHVTDDRGVDQVAGIDLKIREGEIFGVAGVDGNGQSELVEAITGLEVPDRGTIELNGEDVTDSSRRSRIDAGMAYIPEDRQARGLVMDFDLVENGLLGSQHTRSFAPGGRIDWEGARGHATTLIDEYDVRPPDPNTTAKSLSGGNQQKFVVGREFLRDPSVVVASHPTRGVDVGSIEFIHDRLLDLRHEGKAILLISSKLDEVQGLSDRLGVIYEGEFIDVVDPDAVTDEQLGLLMAGEQPAGAPSIAGESLPESGGNE